MCVGPGKLCQDTSNRHSFNPALDLRLSPFQKPEPDAYTFFLPVVESSEIETDASSFPAFEHLLS